MKNIYFIIALLNIGYFFEVKPSVEANQLADKSTAYATIALKDKKVRMERDKLNAECSLDNCCLSNIEAPRNEHGVPLPCRKVAAMLAMYAGAEAVDKKISDFNKYAPAPTQTRQEYEAEAKEKEKPKSKGWFW
ncbi:MAG: hypothetical protein P4L31_07795 [Candidatus Babeliales bacterium]|nr:hypothetical protein [Candidatus Babeliales bacterium]